MDLKEQIAIVTGGAQGIGKACVSGLSRVGAKVVVVDLNLSKAEDCITEIIESGGEGIAIRGDVVDTTSVEEVIRVVKERFGRIDIMVNNAGITKDTMLLRMKDDDFVKVLDVNLGSVFRYSREVAKIMIKQYCGRIINISSIIGLIGNPGQANYAASKAAIIGFTKSVAKELGPRNITVNAICPGFIATEMTEILPESVKMKMLERIPLGRFGSTEDVANVVVFLASPQAAYINGQVIVVDGGMI